MKYSLLLTIFFLFVFFENLSAQKKAARQVEEIYYEVSSVGEINRDVITETRKLMYDKNFSFISGKSFVNNKTIELASDANVYYHLPLYQNDRDNCDYNNDRIVRYQQVLNDRSKIDHLLKYDDHANLLEDSFNDSKQKIILTYDYMYLSDFAHDKKEKRLDACESWVMRTIKQNGKIVQYSERKIKGK